MTTYVLDQRDLLDAGSLVRAVPGLMLGRFGEAEDFLSAGTRVKMRQHSEPLDEYRATLAATGPSCLLARTTVSKVLKLPLGG